MFQQLLARLSEALDVRGIPYMVIGGQAVLVYGEPRFTRDIDITLGVGVDRLTEVLQMADSLGLKVLAPPPTEQFVKRTMVLPCQDGPTGIRIDLVFSFSPYEKQAMERIRRVPLDGQNVRFASPEDLLIHKMIAGRPRDLEDVRIILRKNPGVDRPYIEKWLLDFEKALERPLLGPWNDISGKVQGS